MNNIISKYRFSNISMGFAVFILAFIIIVARRPDIIFHAQPWAEDGVIWMKGIYENGFWSSVFYPANGYYQTISRVTYSVAMMFGLSKAPLVANIIAISIRCFFVMFLLSRRMQFIGMKYRLLAVAYFLLMPNIAEGYVNITNVHWYLSLYLMAVVVSDEPYNTSWKTHDYILLFISALSGPFIIFIAPCLIIKRIYQRGGIFSAVKGINSFDIIMATCCVIQLVAILSSAGETRSNAPLGAHLTTLASIISYRVVGGSFFQNSLISSMPDMIWLNYILFFALVISVIVLFLKEGWRFKVSVIFPVLMIGFALAKPMMSLTQPQWPTLLIPYSGERYFIITNIAFFFFILFVGSRLEPKIKSLALILPALLIIIQIPQAHIPALADVGYQNDVMKFNKASTGEAVNIKINPPGWSVTLIKK